MVTLRSAVGVPDIALALGSEMLNKVFFSLKVVVAMKKISRIARISIRETIGTVGRRRRAV